MRVQLAPTVSSALSGRWRDGSAWPGEAASEKKQGRKVIHVPIGTTTGGDMGRFASARHLASWAGMCPGNSESADKRRSGRTRKGSPWLRHCLVEAAHGAAHTKNKYLRSQYHRIAARRGKKKALLAVGHSILVIAYHLLTRKQAYAELGANYFDERDRQAVTKRCVNRLQKLGYQITLEKLQMAA